MKVDSYYKTDWQDAPSTNTPLSQRNLNKLEEAVHYNREALKEVADEMTNLDATSIKDSVAQAGESARSAAESAESAQDSADTSAQNAETATQAAATATQKASEASTSASAASTSASAAKTSSDAAAKSATGAATSEKNAADSKTAAAGSAAQASASATSASQSAAAAQASAESIEGDTEAAAKSAEAAATSAKDAASSATAASASQKAAKTSEDNAKASQTAAKASETNAQSSASAASASATAAEESASEASASAEGAQQSATNAAASASAAAKSAASIGGDVEAAAASASEAKKSETAASASASKAATSETNAAGSAEDAAGSASESATSASNAQKSATAAASSASAASASQTAAKTSETNAKSSQTAAADSASKAAQSATAAAASATTAQSGATRAETAAQTVEDMAREAESYAHGDTGTRVGENTDNAKYYADLAARTVEAATVGALLPMGTITFSQLPESGMKSGQMYNISDDFTSDSRFEIPSAHYSKGSNVYYTANGKWDVLAGVNVTGVKGESESAYQTGNVNITRKGIGLDKVPNVATNDQTPTFTAATTRANITSGEKLSAIFGKIAKWFADLKNVAFTGKYSDLTGTPASLKNPSALTFTGGSTAKYDGSAEKTVEIPTKLPADGGTADYLTPHNIANGTDLNTLVNTGIYRSSTNLITLSLVNCPFPNGSFILFAFLCRDAASYKQLAIGNVSTGNIRAFIRGTYDGVWSDWAELYSDKHKPTLADIGALAADGKAKTAGAADTAAKLATPRIFPAVNLAGSGTATFDGSTSPSALGVTGILPVAKGGTGQTTAQKAAETLLAGLAESEDASAMDTNHLIVQGGTEYESRYYRKKTSTVFEWIKGKLAKVASTGSYTDLSNKPTALKNPNSITFWGKTDYLDRRLVYDGQEGKFLNIPATLVGSVAVDATDAAQTVLLCRHYAGDAGNASVNIVKSVYLLLAYGGPVGTVTSGKYPKADYYKASLLFPSFTANAEGTEANLLTLKEVAIGTVGSTARFKFIVESININITVNKGSMVYAFAYMISGGSKGECLN